MEPKVFRNICLNAHPEGCAAMVDKQINYVKSQPTLSMPKRVLIIGASGGFGLAARIAATFGGGAGTIGVFLEREHSEKKGGTPGWYNNQQFEKMAQAEGIESYSFNSDAFSHETRKLVIDKIKETWGSIDLLIYSIASPARQDPDTGELYKSVLKPIGAPYTADTMDIMKGEISSITIDPVSSDKEISNTVKVMGGEDWELWVNALKGAGVLANGFKTVSFSYIGPKVTYPIYTEGTIGRAKEDLERAADELTKTLEDIDGQAMVSVNKALVTRASSVIPAVSIYISLLYKIMKEKGLHEGCIEQMYRLLNSFLYNGSSIPMDSKGRIRIDDWEMREDVQAEVDNLWSSITTENLKELTDYEGFKEEFLQMHGFDIPGISK